MNTMNDMGLTINDLPTEILSRIFLNLTDNSDRLSVRDVCPRWKSVVDTTVGVQKRVGDEKVLKDGRQMELLTVLGTTGISDCTFGSIFSTPRTEAWPQYLLPHLMKSVTFDGVISRAMYTNLTNPLQNLTSLTFHISTLAHVEVELHKQALSQTITSLSLTAVIGVKICDAMPFGSEETVFKNFCSICDTDFPKLRRFDVTLPSLLYKYYDYDVFSPVKKFLGMRRPQNLETLNFCLQANADELLDVFRAGLRRKDSEMLRLAWEPDDIANFVIHDLDMACVAEYSIYETLLHQHQLESLICTRLTFDNQSLMSMMMKSWATLTEVRLTIKYTASFAPVDCSVFSLCTVLKSLVVNKKDKSYECRPLRDSTVQNVSSLPLSLKTLQLRNLLMDTRSVDYVSKSLELETLVLDGIGSQDNLGMSIPTLLWILKESPTITTLEITGINQSCLSASLGNRLTEPPECQTCKVPHPIQIMDKKLLDSIIQTQSISVQLNPFKRDDM